MEELGGREGLGPAHFRDVLPVTRKHLIPLLGHFDAEGVTHRADGARKVANKPCLMPVFPLPSEPPRGAHGRL